MEPIITPDGKLSRRGLGISVASHVLGIVVLLVLAMILFPAK